MASLLNLKQSIIVDRVFQYEIQTVVFVRNGAAIKRSCEFIIGENTMGEHGNE